MSIHPGEVDVTKDPDTGAVYVKVSRERVARTWPRGRDINIDVDIDGNVVGVEIL
jgi:uncharacterized protein YuzE